MINLNDTIFHHKDWSLKLNRIFKRILLYPMPVVAAINGAALGGGLEIALATHHRIVVDDPKIQLGQPEVQLGLLPGGGGIVRTVRMLGIVDALMQLLLQGKRRKSALSRLCLCDVLVGLRLIHLQARPYVPAHVDVGNIDGQDLKRRAVVEALVKHSARDHVRVFQDSLVALGRAHSGHYALAHSRDDRSFAGPSDQPVDIGAHCDTRLGLELDARAAGHIRHERSHRVADERGVGVLVEVGVDLESAGVQAGLVSESARADVRLAAVGRDVGDLADGVRDPGGLTQPLRLERESTLPWTEQQPDLSATLSPDDKTLRIFAVNTSTDPHPVLFELPGAGESATATVLKDQQNALCAEVINTRDAPARIKPAAYPLETRGTTFEFAFEPLSLTLLEVTMSP